MYISGKLAHKVKNKLSVILGAIELAILNYEENNTKDARKFLETAKKEIHALSFMLNGRIREDLLTEDDLTEEDAQKYRKGKKP